MASKEVVEPLEVPVEVAAAAAPVVDDEVQECRDI